jgi:hypothetical protein
MSTTTPTTPITTPRTARSGRSRRTVVGVSLLGLVAAGSTATAIALATQGAPHPVAAPAPAAAPVHQVPVQHTPVQQTPVQPAPAPVHHTVVVPVRPAEGTHTHVAPKPPAQPSAAVETLQRELGQLNYYEGPVTGFVDAQTTQAITYLQRDAHLPQTGRMDAATTQALENFLAHGNNQMGS